jgi:hypothetical protein
VTCLPHTLDDILPTLDACARAAGGPDWPSAAILGAQVVAVAFLVAALVGFLVAKVTQP